MTKEQIKDIFIEEATEIIEKLSVDIINFEENPEDKNLLNELFRGVHTLKGSANSFELTKLSEFVHHFEDILDYYRSANEVATHKVIDLFLDAVDIIKEVMWNELDGSKEVPKKFYTTLDGLKNIIAHEKTDDEKETFFDLGLEFSGDEETKSQHVQRKYYNEDDVFEMQKLLKDKEELYYIVLQLDEDIYFRGLDYSKFFKLLSQEGKIIESWWDMDSVPLITELDPENNYIKRVDILYVSDKPINTITELFEYIEKHEYSLEHLEKETIQPLEQKKSTTHVKKTTTSFVKIDTNKLDELFDSIGELVIAQNFIAESEEIKQLNSEDVTKTMNTLSKITRLIQNRVMSLRMVTINDTFEKMKRVARDASKRLNKDISLEIFGADTEIDKTMIDALSEPLIHLIRNAIDHGIEDSIEDRQAQGKSDIGIIKLRAFHKGGNIAIEVSDDGKGINREKVFLQAIERGIIKADEELKDEQVFALILQAGFTTSEIISDISGRGVGLDVVRSSIEKLHGRIEITSEVGKGSTFTILLPLTLAIIDGMIVKSGSDTYIIPILSVLESFIPAKNMVHSIKRQGEFVDLRGEMIPIVRLNHVLELNSDKPEIYESTLLCVESEKGKYAILVDDLVGRQQVVIKSLGPTLSRIKELSGSAIMGSGDIALILNIEELY